MFLHCFNAKKTKKQNALGEVIYFKVSPQASVTQTWNQSATTGCEGKMRQGVASLSRCDRGFSFHLAVGSSACFVLPCVC